MCSSSTGDHPFNITWLKNQQIIYNSNLNSLHGAGARNQKSHASTSSSLGNEEIAGGTHSRKHDNSYFVDSTINISDYPPYSSILTIENLTSHDNGNYTCQISNHGGVVEHTAFLSVAGLYSPHFLCCGSPTHAHIHRLFHCTQLHGIAPNFCTVSLTHSRTDAHHHLSAHLNRTKLRRSDLSKWHAAVEFSASNTPAAPRPHVVSIAWE